MSDGLAYGIIEPVPDPECRWCGEPMTYEPGRGAGVWRHRETGKRKCGTRAEPAPYVLERVTLGDSGREKPCR